MPTYSDAKNYLANKEKQEKAELQNKMRRYAYMHYFTENARTRLSNIGLVKPNLYNYILDVSIRLARDGHLDSRIDNDELKILLADINKPRDTKIRRI